VAIVPLAIRLLEAFTYEERPFGTGGRSRDD
jgi:hypothetical protein